ncbi:rhs family protein, partial [mine drainage metagenome]
TTYGYDAEGNTLNVLSLATTTPATVDLNDRLTSWNWQTYTYDADGNLTGNGTDTYVWNARNQLATVKQGSTTIASFSYDPLGRRVGTDFNGNAASYLYDGLNAVQETHGGTATSILTGLAVDERFARTDLSGRTDFLSDALNSTMALTNNAGAIVEQYSYDPYGATTASMSGFDNPYQYTGRENDGDGLYYYRARYYAPA